MQVKRLELTEFRTYRSSSIEIPAPGLRIVGRNAAGKTSVLEALVLLSTTRSTRAGADREMVRWDSGSDYGVNPYARVEATIEASGDISQLGISMELDPTGQTVVRKHFQVNGETVRAFDMVGAAKTVLFSPEDVLLVTGPPVERRRQMDILISQTDRAYLHALSAYSRVQPQRNQLLKRFARERRDVRDAGAIAELTFWDEELVAAGAAVVATRIGVARSIASQIQERSQGLVSEATVGFRYDPRLDLEGIDLEGKDEAALRQDVALAFQEQLLRVRGDEFRRGMTLLGPHRDDFTFLIDGRSLSAYGSRGQQRLGVVAFRLAEIDILTNRSGEKPILLLDDVLSELDAVHRETLLSEIVDCGCQVMITSTDDHMLDRAVLQNLPYATVENGTIRLQ